MQTLVQHRRHELRRVAARAREVWAAHVADEKRVARQNLLRLRRDFRVNDDDGDAFGRVPRRFEKAQDDFPDLYLVAVAHRKVLEARARLRAEDDLRARARREFTVAAHEVCVQVRLNDVLDFQPSRLCLGDVLVNVALRVNDRGLAFRADEIGGVREASEVELFEVHVETPVRLAVRPGDFPRANSIPPRRLRAIIGGASDAARRLLEGQVAVADQPLVDAQAAVHVLDPVVADGQHHGAGPVRPVRVGLAAEERQEDNDHADPDQSAAERQHEATAYGPPEQQPPEQRERGRVGKCPSEVLAPDR